MSPLGSLIDPDRNCCPLFPNSSPPPIHTPTPLPPLSFSLPPRSCLFGADHGDLALEVVILRLSSELHGGGKMSEPGCQKHIQAVIRHPSMTINLWWTVVFLNTTGKSLHVSEKTKMEFYCICMNTCLMNQLYLNVRSFVCGKSV